MESVGLSAQPPDVFGKLSSILNVKQQQQALIAQGAQTQMLQQEAKQRTALANIDWDKHMGEDGTLDLGSFTKDQDIRKAAGDSYPQLIEHATAIKTHQVGAKGALMKLTQEQIGAYGSMLGALADDEDVVAGNESGRAKAKAVFTQFAQTYGMDAAKAIAPVALPLMNDKIPADKIGKMVQHVQLQAQDVGRQLEAMKSQPQFVQGPKGLQGIETNQYAQGGVAAPVGPPVAQGVAPGVTIGPNGQLIRIQPDATAQPINAPPGVNPNSQQQHTNVELARGVTDRVMQATSTANNTVQAQDALSRAKAILESPEAPNTGSAFERKKGLKNLMSSLGIDTAGADDDNSLVKNLARYEAARAAASGLGGTDAARELAHNGSPNTQIDKKALIGIVNQSLATEKALSAYAAKQSKTKDPDQLQRNESAFRSIPNLIEGYEYGMSRNKKEADEFLRRHGMTADEMKKTRVMIKAFEGE